MSTITKERVKDILEFGAARIISPITDDEIMELARIALASLEPININDDMVFAFCRAITDDAVSVDEIWPIKLGLRAAFANVAAPPAPVSVPEDIPDSVYEILSQACGRGEKAWNFADELWNACRAAMLHGADGALTDEDTREAFDKRKQEVRQEMEMGARVTKNRFKV
ncbi:hypothetical protein RY966_002397 [Enterobacter kobei]|nr:hypothetical protein [Enterobacter kobei]